MDVYGLIGNPVGHSLSPPMHEAGYDALGLDARYVTFEPPADSGVEAIESAETLGVSGLNVTIPFKRDVLPAVEPDPLAARIGAVNTVDFSGDRVTGHNTDAVGAVRALRDGGVELSGTAVVVGAGGAGRAIAFALADEGMAVRIANRTESTAHDLAADVRGEGGGGSGSEGSGSEGDGGDGDDVGGVGGGGRNDDGQDATGSSRSGATDRSQPDATGHGLDELDDLLADADVLVNATSVGMESDETPVPAAALHGDLGVLDAVYRPLETRLLEDAAAARATTVDGAWMLLFQGVAAFERWTGRDAPVDAMNAALRARL